MNLSGSFSTVSAEGTPEAPDTAPSTSLNQSFSRAHFSEQGFKLLERTLPATVLAELERQLAEVPKALEYITPPPPKPDAEGKIKGALQDNTALSAYMPFSLPRPRSFINSVTLLNTYKGEPRAPEAIKISEWHETIHAAQWVKSSSLHASPYNRNTSIFLTPESYIKSVLLTEADAYAKQAWMATLAAQDNPNMRETLSWAPISVEEFERLSSETGNIQAALIEAAYDSLSKVRVKKTGQTFYEHYVDQALHDYENCYRFGTQGREFYGEYTFARMDAQDMHQIGEAIGLNSLGENSLDERFADRLQLTEDQKKKLDKLNSDFGISSEAEVPTLKEALLRQGMTRSAFLEHSKTAERHIEPVVKPESADYEPVAA